MKVFYFKKIPGGSILHYYYFSQFHLQSLFVPYNLQEEQKKNKKNKKNRGEIMIMIIDSGGRV